MKTSVILPVMILGVVAAGAVAVAGRRAQLDLGVGYAARVACGCRFIGGRPLADCPRDFEPGMELIRLSEDSAARSVTASVPLLTQRTARFDPVLGCQPDRFTGTALRVAH